MKKTIFLFIGFLFFSSFLTGQEVQVIAHRGFWKPEGSAQNSIVALEQANRINLYGSEFDIHMTADDVLVVFHDDKIKEVEIQKVPYTVIKDSLLSNGEKIPTLREYLEAAKRTDIQLIFELKPHATPERNREAARASIELVNEKNLAHRTEYITFNLDAGKELIKLAPEAKVYYLNGELSPQELKRTGFCRFRLSLQCIKKTYEMVCRCKETRIEY